MDNDVNINEDEILRDVLNMDGLYMAEKITGKSYKEDRETESLGFAFIMKLGELRDKLLSERNDTIFSMTWEDYASVMLEYGFEVIHKHSFLRKGNQKDTFFIWYHPKGLLLVWDTYGKQRNSAKVYYNWKPNEKYDLAKDFSVTSSGHFVLPERKKDDSEWFVSSKCTWVGDHDAREAFVFHMDQLEEYGKFVTPWVDSPFLWFVDGSQAEDDEYNYKEINKTLIKTFPKKIRKLFGI